MYVNWFVALATVLVTCCVAMDHTINDQHCKDELRNCSAKHLILEAQTDEALQKENGKYNLHHCEALKHYYKCKFGAIHCSHTNSLATFTYSFHTMVLISRYMCPSIVLDISTFSPSVQQIIEEIPDSQRMDRVNGTECSAAIATSCVDFWMHMVRVKYQCRTLMHNFRSCFLDNGTCDAPDIAIIMNTFTNMYPEVLAFICGDDSE